MNCLQTPEVIVANPIWSNWVPSWPSVIEYTITSSPTEWTLVRGLLHRLLISLHYSHCMGSLFVPAKVAPTAIALNQKGLCGNSTIHSKVINTVFLQIHLRSHPPTIQYSTPSCVEVIVIYRSEDPLCLHPLCMECAAVVTGDFYCMVFCTRGTHMFSIC